MSQMLRHEEKYPVTPKQYDQLREMGRRTLLCDPHTTDGIYLVRSLYFDTWKGKDYQAAMNGDLARHKMRLRTYGMAETFFRLEEKYKKNGLSGKRDSVLTPEQAQEVAKGNNAFLEQISPYGPRLAKILQRDAYRPALTVNYWRDVFYLPEDDFRLTLDWNIAYGAPEAFWHPEQTLTPDPDRPIVLEVKYLTAPPAWLTKQLEEIGVVLGQNSKYCRGIQTVFDGRIPTESGGTV